MKKLSKLLLGLILSFMVIQVPLALSNAVYAVDDTTTEDVVTPKSGLVYEDDQFVYYSDGEVDKGFKGLAEYKGEKYYVQNGTVDTTLTDVVYIDGTWYYIDQGRLNEETRDVIFHCGGWYFVENGTINWNYTGLAYHAGGWYYINRGVLDWGYTGLAQVNGQGTYYEVVNGVMINSPLDKMRNLVRNESSPTQYIILVDRAAHRVGIFRGSKGNWQDVQYYQCCVGKPSTPTVSGTFYVGSKGKYFDTGSRGRCWYYTQITGNYLFHSVIYDRQNTPKRIIDNSMDKAVSHGCVRLDIDHAKWIYDNIPRNTKVIIY